MSNFSLSPDQKDALDKFVQWWNGNYKTNNDKMFVLVGPAGSGKTTLVHQLIRNINLKEENVVFCALSGQASLVLRKKGNKNAFTIHSVFYKLEEETEEKLIFKKRDKLLEDYRLIVLDESSMINSDMLNDIKSFNIPILVIGDKEQLPPVESTSVNLLEHPDAELTTIHRQALLNPIIKYATDIRFNRPRYLKEIELVSGDFYVVCVDRSRFTQEQLDETLIKSSQILVGTHRIRKAVNDRMRLLNGIDINKNPLPVKGDKLICKRNSWKKTLTNQEIKTKILEKDTIKLFENIEKEDKTKYNFLSDDSITSIEELEFYNYPLVNGTIGYAFSDVNIEVEERFQKYFDKFGAINPYVAKLDFRPNYVSHQVEYFEDLSINIPFLLETNNNEETYTKLKNIIEDQEIVEKFYFDSFFQYGYAITVHSSQGSQYDNILIINENFMKENYYRWLYTAVTRAVNSVIILK